jgi:rod shape-determining protein MreD
MRWLRFSILLLIITLLDAGRLLDVMSVGTLHIRPMLLLILLIFFAVRCDTEEAIITSFSIGFAVDITGSVMGPYMLSFGMLGSFISLFRKSELAQGMVYQFFLVLMIGGLSVMIAEGLIALKTGEASLQTFIAFGGAVVYSAVIGPFVWPIFGAVTALMGLGKGYFGQVSNR